MSALLLPIQTSGLPRSGHLPSPCSFARRGLRCPELILPNMANLSYFVNYKMQGSIIENARF